MRALRQILFTVLIIAGFAGLIAFIVMNKEAPEQKPPEPFVPKVEALLLEPDSVTLTVQAQGTVTAQTQSTLSAEVGGRVVSVARNFRPGGFVREGEVLVRIEAADYKAIIAQQQARVAQSELAIAQEEAQSEQARTDWARLGRGEPSSLALREPQLVARRAELASAQAELARAHRDLERTQVRAPYDGRIINTQVDVGQRVSIGSPLALVHATDVAEVRLPLTLAEISQLDLPLAYEGERPQAGPVVQLTATLGDTVHQWPANLTRTEAAIDERTRFIYAIATVKDPYIRDPKSPERPPLMLGLFVEAQIEGKTLEGVFALPRSALHRGDEVWLVDDQQLEIRKVKIAATDASHAYIGAGLNAGERVITTQLEQVVDGMQVLLTPSRTLEAEATRESTEGQPTEPTLQR
jgi:RND family efflux transporter MFP subunit